MPKSCLCETDSQVRLHLLLDIDPELSAYTGLYAEKKNLEQKNQELAGAFREKSKAQQRLQGLYQKLKSQQNAHHIEHAAADDADDVIHSINGATHFSNDAYGGMAPQRPPVPHSRGQDLPQIYSHARVGSTGSGGSGKRNNVTYQQGAQYSRTDLVLI